MISLVNVDRSQFLKDLLIFPENIHNVRLLFLAVNNLLKPRFRYDMMLKCWQQVPKKRPTFTQLREELESIMSDGETYLSLDIDLTSNYYTTPSYKSFSGKHDEMTVSIVDA